MMTKETRRRQRPTFTVVVRAGKSIAELGFSSVKDNSRRTGFAFGEV